MKRVILDMKTWRHKIDVSTTATWRQIFKQIGSVTGISATNLIIKPGSKDAYLSWREFGMFDVIATDLHDRERIFVTWIVHVLPIHNAAINGNAVAIERWFASGAKIDEPDQNGITPLMIAARWLHVDCVVILLELGADPTRINTSGGTALHRVAASAFRDDRMQTIVRLLIGAGCDPEIQDHDDRSAFEIAHIWQGAHWGARFKEWTLQPIE